MASLIPYRYTPSRRRTLFSAVSLTVLLLLVLTGLGVFRLYFGFEWTAGEDDSGQIFSLKIRGGNSFDLFDATPLGEVFWTTTGLLAAMALLLPHVRPVFASLLALVVAGTIVLLHLRFGPAVPRIPIEFELLIVLVLYAVHMAMSYAAELRDRKRFSALLSQYVPPALAAAYSRDPQSMGLAGEEREVSVLFCDVVGFSAVAEQLGPRELAAWLNGFFSLVSRVVVRHGGTIDKYIGDSVMAVWGAPAPSRTHAFDALAAGLDIVAELGDLDARCRAEGLPPIRVGVGISTGLANVGPLGSEFRMDYTVVGDMVNVAQRLERQTRKYPVPLIVSAETADALPDMLFRELDTVRVKGRAQPVTMLEPLGARAAAAAELVARLDLHREAMSASKRGDRARAGALFARLRDEWGPSEMYELYLHGIARAGD